jgi:molybdopterin/thiamine biosynthesis adenylyltransferase
MKDRYSRQMLFHGIGKAGQERLRESNVVLIGMGALGSAHAETLARAGVGSLRLVDRDFVEASNLQRQTLYSESDAESRLPKSIAAAKRIREINSDIATEAVIDDVNGSNIEGIVADADLVLDGSDNFLIRYTLNDAAVKLGITWIYGAAVSGYGASMTIRPGKSPCLACVFEEMPEAGSGPTCDTAGVIQPIIQTISAIQTTEALKILTGREDKLHNGLIQADIWENQWKKIALNEPTPDCRCCGRREFEFLSADMTESVTTMCGRDAVQIRPPGKGEFDLDALKQRLSTLSGLKVNEYLVRFSADGLEVTVFSDGRAIIRGTDDPSIARGVYSRYVGI